MDSGWLLFGASLVSALAAMSWSFLMASKVAAPRAAAKSKLLLVGILTGKTEEDREILAEVQDALIRPVVEAALSKMELPDMKGVEATINAMQTNFTEFQNNIPDLNIEEIGRVVESHVMMALKNEQASMVKSTQAQLIEMGIPQALADTQQSIIAQLPANVQGLNKLANWKVSKRFKEEHELEAFGLELAKTQILSMLEGQRENILSGLMGQVVQGGNGGQSSNGSGFRPGYQG